MRTSCHSALVQGTQGPRAGLPECGGGCQGKDKGSGLSQLIDGPAGPSFLDLLARAPCPWDRELPRGSFAFPSLIPHKCELQGFLQHCLNPGGQDAFREAFGLQVQCLVARGQARGRLVKGYPVAEHKMDFSNAVEEGNFPSCLFPNHLLIGGLSAWQT